MTTHNEALLAAILADPADDSVRLIYADWLEENGQQERAEFIRHSLHDPYGGQYSASADMAREFRPHAGWEGVPNNVDNSWVVQVHRGFLRFAHCSCQDWLDHGPALVRVHPLERVEFSDREPYHSHHADNWDGTLKFCWRISKTWRLGNALPPTLYHALVEGTPSRGLTARGYDTRETALDALSTAALAWAKAGAPTFRSHLSSGTT